MDPLLKEALVGTAAMTALGAVVSLAFWGFTGLSPWPGVILGQVAGYGFGLAMLMLTSPKRNR